MAREIISPTEHYAAVMEAMASHGLLLGSYDASGKGNLMTIGWGAMGRMWNVPVWIVLVRPSRYTWRCIEHSGCFTVNVPGESLAMACATCGSRSGRDLDKFAEAGLTQERAEAVLAPAVAECPIVYECRVVHASDVLPEKLTDEILDGSYVEDDFHRVYVGKILRAAAEADAAERLKR